MNTRGERDLLMSLFRAAVEAADPMQIVAASAGAAAWPHAGDRGWKSVGPDGSRGRAELARALGGIGSDPLWLQGPDRANRDRRSGAPGSRPGRAGRGHQDLATGARSDCGRPGAMPDFRWWVVLAAASGERPDAGG